MYKLLLGTLWCHVHFASATIYHPLREYAGSTFFDRWDYYGNIDDTTLGNVTYQHRDNATSKGLAFVNAAGNAVIKVDNATTIAGPGPGVYRDSIRITSQDAYAVGSLIIIDALHIPFGCSVWPAFWTLGIGARWPAAGEIDIIEAINLMGNNQVAVHTLPGCFPVTPTAPQTGNILQPDCSSSSGCVVAETKVNSYGIGFGQAGGGVFALQLDATGVFAWFWSRPDIPENIRSADSASTIDTSLWGMPSAAHPASGCNVTQMFGPQQLILLTTLCGVWAGVPEIYGHTCQTPTGDCVLDNVVGPGTTYDNAYWEIRNIRTYVADGVTPYPAYTSTASASSASPTSASSTSSSRPGTTSSTPGRPSSGGTTMFVNLTLTLMAFITMAISL
ncbi:concanavalin A-like lectin/glucanase domain-containing protein [Cyathus striatus]|nr:concanavalin A-like lectin/glucanase domain-containing protein [Cyathus striatus]